MHHSGRTPEPTGPTIERVLSNGKRLVALAFRRWLVEQARKPGASVAGLALRHGINANLLRRWMTVDSQINTSDKTAALLPITRDRRLRGRAWTALRGTGTQQLPVRRLGQGRRPCRRHAHKLNGLDPQAYLRHVFERIAEHPIKHIEELLPWNVAVQRTIPAAEERLAA